MRVIGYDHTTERTLPFVLRDQAEHIGDDLWLMCDDLRYSFAQANQILNEYAAGVMKLGVEPGDRVAVMMRDTLEFVFLYYSLAKTGAILVPVNPDLKGEFLRHVLGHSGTSVLIVDEDALPQVLALRSELPDLRQLVVRGECPTNAGGLRVFPLAELQVAHASEPAVELIPRSPTSILYTSGTTGRPKGVYMSQGYTYISTIAAYAGRDVKPDDIFYAVSPMFHASVWQYSITAALFTGLPAAVNNRPFSVSGFWDQVRRYGVTQLMTVGTMHFWMWKQPERPDDADNPVRLWDPLPLPANLWEPFKKRYGLEHLVQGYGQTECMCVAWTDPSLPITPGAAGRATAFYDIVILDDDDIEVPRGTAGEICYRSKVPCGMFLGYYQEPEITLETWRNFWHHSGDIGKMNESGELFFIDRKKDYLRVKGENISSAYVEEVVLKHPAVGMVAAHAVPSEDLEDDLKLTVLVKPDEKLDPEELALFCDGVLPRFALPRYIEIVEELPMTPTGKVQKYKLRELGVTPTTWDRRAQ